MGTCVCECQWATLFGIVFLQFILIWAYMKKLENKKKED